MFLIVCVCIYTDGHTLNTYIYKEILIMYSNIEEKIILTIFKVFFKSLILNYNDCFNLNAF